MGTRVSTCHVRDQEEADDTNWSYARSIKVTILEGAPKVTYTYLPSSAKPHEVTWFSYDGPVYSADRQYYDNKDPDNVASFL